MIRGFEQSQFADWKWEIMSLIGHNGAGKSTTIKSLVSIISPSSGRILVDGQDLSENRLAIKRKIGYVADSPDLFLRLTANEFWELIASSYDLTQLWLGG